MAKRIARRRFGSVNPKSAFAVKTPAVSSSSRHGAGGTDRASLTAVTVIVTVSACVGSRSTTPHVGGAAVVLHLEGEGAGAGNVQGRREAEGAEAGDRDRVTSIDRGDAADVNVPLVGTVVITVVKVLADGASAASLNWKSPPAKLKNWSSLVLFGKLVPTWSISLTAWTLIARVFGD